ncbi:MAG: glycosyltransferase family 4 protein [Gomphosphaeria aponina SAG 52.96 = DSM 107014]|uniref:Glycosyltransferase family 4 protein n=1 Tax=Gomphosphaeria aponina SAG 52.96 = DSM 107014 TaxID=1521640 RepID=A0A941GLY0_9CHRO|nr:glycosyltransferase family 4 protein [Gomphosphaeria aponina SAG 52.96 = DSM 107014]
MNILYTLTTYPPAIGGAQLHQHILAQNLKNNHQIQVITHWNENRTDWLLGTTINAPSSELKYTIDGIDVHRLGFSLTEKLKLFPSVLIYYFLMDTALASITPNLIKHLKPYAQQGDLIHNVRIGREGLSYASYQVAKEHDIPFVFTPVHHPRWVGWRYRSYIKLYQLADGVICLTNVEKQTLVKLGVQEDKITVTGIGPIFTETANPISFKKKHQIDEPIVLFLGQHYPYKGYQQLLQATKLVWEKIPETNFIFIGPSVANSEKYFQEFQDKRIYRLGMVNLQEKTDALAACSLLCVPSSQESFGGVYTEAWSFAKPVMGCDIPAVAEVISNGLDGYLVQQNPQEIADAICQLLLNPSQAQKMGEAGENKVKQHFTWQKLAEKTEQFYQKLL